MKGSFDIMDLVRENVKTLSPYRSARDEFEGKAKISLDANENPFDHESLNRYPDPYQKELKRKISQIKNVPTNSVFLGNGSDEAIDLLIRAFCEPGKDSILTFTPTYGMYKISADINAVDTIQQPLNESFQIDLEKAMSAKAKLIFICSPNNPTGNEMETESVEAILNQRDSIVVIDEAYIDFAEGESWINRLSEFPNLVVMQTFSKAYGMAGVRLGMAFASSDIIEVLNKIKPPYNINSLTQNHVLQALENTERFDEEVATLLGQREILERELKDLPQVQRVFPSAANFLLVQINQARELYQALAEKGIVVRDRSTQVKSALRITVGTAEENEILIQNIKEFYS